MERDAEDAVLLNAGIDFNPRAPHGARLSSPLKMSLID